MAGEPEGDCRVQRPKSKGIRARGWQLLFLGCFLCSAATRLEDNVEVEPPQTQPNTHNAPYENPQNGLSAQEIKKKVRQGKARRKEKGKAWYACFLRKSTAVSQTDKLTKGNAVPHTNNCFQRLPNAQESFRLAEACLDKVLDKLEKDRERAIGRYIIQRSRKTLEANRMWSCLPLRPEDTKRAVTFQEPAPKGKVSTDTPRKPSKRDLEWRRVLDEVRKEQQEKAAEDNRRQEMRTQEPRWLTFLKGRSFDFKKDLTTLLLACIVFLFAWFCATTLSNTAEMYHTPE
ncbi:hypothetical protein ACEWY4_003275 [Coilia grayii]|uniref:Transmembrane protein n=1 Tax=Coilia grayii TaxID=363190 RepID=A0ABD1KQQ9_9TELE